MAQNLVESVLEKMGLKPPSCERRLLEAALSDAKYVKDEEITLADVQPGASVLVLSIGGDDALRQRLLDLGFIPNTRVKVLRCSPHGDPVAYRLRGVTYALRKREASVIKVVKAGDGQ